MSNAYDKARRKPVHFDTPRVTAARTALILEALQDTHDAEWCGHYGESGYHDPVAGIIFCDWNNVSRRIGAYLDAAGYECEWSDEWYIDYNHDKAWRTSGDSYGWVRAIGYTEHGEVLTPDDSIDDWILEYQMTDKADNPHALPDWISEDDITERGYVAINGDYENGFHPGQNDKPEEIARKAFAAGAESVIFRIKQASQFYIVFQGYVLQPEVQS